MHRKYLWKLRFSTGYELVGVHFLAGVLGEDRGGCPQASLLSDAQQLSVLNERLKVKLEMTAS
jgi:hypothetical protein